MTNAERIYVDPSTLRSLYLHDHRSRAFCAWRWRLRGSLAITRYGRAELVNAIALAAFRGDVTREVAEAATTDVEDDLVAGRLRLTDLTWRRALDTAADLSRRHTPSIGTRSLDVLHVAAALTLGMGVFVTYDGRQAKLATAVGLRVLQP